ncbi:MAG: polysaccharide deacetylase family protein [Bacteroidetes bacterium]|nr:polysaccharide deacetylase family protein [Bacteroidota bacterium]
MYQLGISLLFFVVTLHTQSLKPKIAFTFDDRYPRSNVMFDSEEGNRMVLDHLSEHNIKGAYFVAASMLESETGRNVLTAWDNAGHVIANHSYSHQNYHSDNVSIENYKNDFLKADTLLSSYKSFRKLYRFPMLREGNTIDKRDGFRETLTENNYQIGYVTVDNTEWFINNTIRQRLANGDSIDVDAYKRIYIDHLYNLAVEYDSLALSMFARQIPHIMLVHNNITSALFLGDLIQKFKDEDWEIVDASEAFSDELYLSKPDVIWQRGQSILFSIAKERGLITDETKTFNITSEEILEKQLEALE